MITIEEELDIGMMVRVFTNSLGDQGLIPGRVTPKTQKIGLDASLLNTQHYEVQIKGKVELSRERSSTLSDSYRKGSFGSLSTKVVNFTIKDSSNFGINKLKSVKNKK